MAKQLKEVEGMTFVERLTKQDVEKFFEQHQIKGEVIWKPEFSCAMIKSSTNSTYCSLVKFTDTLIKAERGMELKSGDWQVFLRGVFGDEYMQAIGKKDYSVDFVHALSHDEILELIPFYHVYSFEECEALQLGTRRFKIRPGYDSSIEEVILGPLYTDGNIRFYGVKESAFYEFMVQRFGITYYQYFCEREREEVKEDIWIYVRKRIEEAVNKEETVLSFLPE